MFNMDASLLKNVPLPREGMSLQLRVESFNTFNVQNWNAPSGTTINAASPGQITDLAQGTNPREIQFGLRFVF